MREQRPDQHESTRLWHRERHKLPRRMPVTACAGLTLVMLMAGCRSETDQQIDTLVSRGIAVTRDSAGNVTWVDSSGARLDEHFWSTLGNFEQLQQLSLTGSPVKDEDLTQLTSLRRLQSLDLSYTRITPVGLRILSRVEDLHTLSLNGLPLGSQAVEPLCRLTGLRSLSLMDTELTDADIQKIEQSMPACLIVR